MRRKKSFKSTSFRFTEIGSPVYFLAGGGALPAGGCGSGGGFCGLGTTGSSVGRANASSFPVSDGGRGICGTLGDVRFCFAGFRAAGSAAGVRAAGGGRKEIVKPDASACTL